MSTYTMGAAQRVEGFRNGGCVPNSTSEVIMRQLFEPQIEASLHDKVPWDAPLNGRQCATVVIFCTRGM
jgi:hypothetical protein